MPTNKVFIELEDSLVLRGGSTQPCPEVSIDVARRAKRGNEAHIHGTPYAFRAGIYQVDTYRTVLARPAFDPKLSMEPVA